VQLGIEYSLTDLKGTIMETSRAIETDILLLCAASSCGAAPSSSGTASAKLTRLVESKVRWSLLLDAAERHNLLPVLYLNLKRLKSSAIPENILKALEVRFVEHSRASVQMLDVLTTVLASFESAGVLAVPFKGPILGERFC